MKNRIKCITLFVVLLLAIVPVEASLSFSTSSPQTIAKGDTVTIVGTGATNGTVTLWIIGRNYFRISTAVPDTTGKFAITVRPEDTVQFSSGQYAFVIQDRVPTGDRRLVTMLTGTGT